MGGGGGGFCGDKLDALFGYSGAKDSLVDQRDEIFVFFFVHVGGVYSHHRHTCDGNYFNIRLKQRRVSGSGTPNR